MKLDQILENVGIKNQKGDLDLDITNIHSDSRKLKEGALFVAIDGFTSNGIQYIDNAIENGAIAIIVEPNEDVDQLYDVFMHLEDYDWNEMGRKSRSLFEEQYTFERMKKDYLGILESL